ncbi:MAG: hypothetical protein IJT87_09530 [Ruminiclostridium sp.]|nr:hypothetical protein [Ruminiclostridium sp.]
MGINIDSLMKAASRQLGMPEDKLREAVKSGDIAAVKQYMQPADRDKLDGVLKDKAQVDAIGKKFGGR